MKKLILLIVLFFVASLLGFGWFLNELRPVTSDNTQKRFVIDEGESAYQIGQDLAKAGFIRNAIAFRIYSQVTQTARNIKPGSYDLTSNLWVMQIVNKLLAGPTEVWVTVPEGLRREEVMQKYIEGLEITGKKATNFSSQFLNLTANKEGFLFPDTYLFAKDSSASAVVVAMENNFDKKYTEAAKTKASSLSKEQIVILASIIQREAITPEDMQGVASVLMNRLSNGMTFGSDVTLEYALGQQPDGNWWKKDLTIDDLALVSPYNTRLNAGLPPTPISNPGLTAIEAAMNPPHTDYLYYLSDSEGKLHFARTLDEHNTNIQKYLQ